MSSKKIMIISIVGFLVSLALFGGAVYVMKNASNKEKEVKTYIYDVGEVTTNIGGTQNYFKGNITIELLDKKEIKKITNKSFIIRDTILNVLISQDPKNMTSDSGIEKIKKELISKISKAAKINSVKNVYFTDYIVQ